MTAIMKHTSCSCSTIVNSHDISGTYSQVIVVKIIENKMLHHSASDIAAQIAIDVHAFIVDSPQLDTGDVDQHLK